MLRKRLMVAHCAGCSIMVMRNIIIIINSRSNQFRPVLHGLVKGFPMIKVYVCSIEPKKTRRDNLAKPRLR